jgi:hypothetical protein
VKSKRSTDIIDLNQSSWLGVRAKITPTSLTLPQGLTYEQWAEIGPRIARINRFSTWATSDWLNFGEARYGETYAQAADATGFDPDYLAIIKSVGASVAPSRRRECLSFTHHRLVASLDPDLQERFLAKAEKKRWNCEELRQAIRDFKHANGKALKRFGGEDHQPDAEINSASNTRDDQGVDSQTGEQTEPARSLSPRYDVMIEAIEQCYATDPLEHITDKALALKLYAQQAQNFEPEQKLIKIRLRAQRQFKQLQRRHEQRASRQGPTGANK